MCGNEKIKVWNVQFKRVNDSGKEMSIKNRLTLELVKEISKKEKMIA